MSVGPAFYSLRPGGWRDYVTLLHLPYTAWHLSYVAIGGCLAPTVSWERLGLCLVAFALAMGIGAHALDELHGRPLQTAVPSRSLVIVAVLSVSAAMAIGIVVALDFSLWILVAVAFGGAFVPLYNLELLGGRLHTDLWFALAWGGFPTLTGYLACAGRLELSAVVVAAATTVISLAQRRLSTPVRRLRRVVLEVEGTTRARDGSRTALNRESLIGPSESALRLLSLAFPLVATALALMRAGW